VRRDFLEPVDPGNGEHAGFLIDRELVALGRVDLFSVKESDDEHDAVLYSQCGLTRSYGRFHRLWGAGINGPQTLDDNQLPLIRCSRHTDRGSSRLTSGLLKVQVACHAERHRRGEPPQVHRLGYIY